MAAKEPLLRTTAVQAFARTVVDPTPHNGDVITSPARTITPSPAIVVLPQTGDVVGGHYRLDDLLGQGMFGKVYLASRIDVPEHKVALKLLPRALYAGRNVERELVMLATVGHPHIVELKDHGTTSEYVWLTMPVYQGETLGERLERGTLSLREAHHIFVALAEGLEALHAAGLRHQDVKPDNVFLATFGRRVHPVLLDLGVAVEKDASFVAGTALFGAPEQILALAGAPPLNALSEKMDTYGLATTLLYALVGPKHFAGEDAKDRSDIVKAQQIRAAAPLHPDALTELDAGPREALVRALCRWLALEPDARPSVRELATELDVLLEQERADALAEEQRRARQKRTILRMQIAFGAMLLVGLGAAGFVYNKREALRIAAQLAEAKRRNDESFDKLDTCVMSHRACRRDVEACESGRARDGVTYKRALDDLASSGSASQSDQAHKIQAYVAKLRACEDGAANAERQASEERARHETQLITERQTAALDRAALESQLNTARADIAKLTADRDRLASQERACIEERDACKAASKPPPQPAALPSSPHAPSAHAPPHTPQPPDTTTAPLPPPPPPPSQAPPPPQPPPPPSPKPPGE